MRSDNNLLLESLGEKDRKLILDRSTEIPLPVRMRLYEADEPLKYAYFLSSGIASVVTTMSDGATAEVNFTGHEGLIGAFHILGPAKPPTSCFVQIPGAAFRISICDLKEVFAISEGIRERILEFVQEQALTVSQISACNRLHNSHERLARWLLMARDRTQSNELRITQEFLAEMLGARRTTVTLVATALQRSGLIEYRRGRVKITDPEGLEDVACDCYKVIKRLYEGLYRGVTEDATERKGRVSVVISPVE